MVGEFMKFTFQIFFSFLAFLSLGSYASFPVMAASLSQSGLLGMEISGTGLPEMPGGKMEVPSAMEEPGEAITLKQALSLALMKNPELQSFSMEIRAREARILQSRQPLNPELQLEVENFGGSKETRGFEGAETTFSLSQAFLLGGKRAKRVRLATLDRDLAGWDYEAKRLGVLTEVTKAYIDLIAKQSRVILSEDLVRLAEQSYQTVSARVQAGKVSPIDETKASASLSLTRLDLERAKRAFEAAKKILAAAWGDSSPVFVKAEGELNLDPSLPSFEQLSKALESNPDLARWADETEQRRSALVLEEANRIPDLTLSGGIRRLNETQDNVFVLGLSIPLPVFNKNEGAIAEAKTRLLKAEKEQKAAVLKVYSSLSEAYQRMATAFVEATSLKSQVLPALQKAFDAVQEGYRYGKFGYLDVLDTQRTLFESQSQYLEALAAYRKARVDVERLTGTGLGRNLNQNRGEGR
jgi:cobalt-zinc-cadmium efflux system outer membrane protein